MKMLEKLNHKVDKIENESNRDKSSRNNSQ